MIGRFVIVGAGRCGLQLARSLVAADLEVAGVVVRSPRGRRRVRSLLTAVPAISAREKLPPSDVLLIAVPDREIAGAATTLAGLLRGCERLALHTSGRLPATVLAPLEGRGLAVASFHPLVSFPSATGPLVPLAGALATLEGQDAPVGQARRLARTLAMRQHRIASSDKALYHAAAAVAANLTHVLVWAARQTLVEAGFSPTAARQALAPLAQGAVKAATEARGLELLTGPIARGDTETLTSHLAALPPKLAACYRAVGALAVAGLRGSREPHNDCLKGVFEALTAPSRCGSFLTDGPL